MEQIVRIRIQMEEVVMYQVHGTSLPPHCWGSVNRRGGPRAGRTWLGAKPKGLCLLEKVWLATAEAICEGLSGLQFLDPGEG